MPKRTAEPSASRASGKKPVTRRRNRSSGAKKKKASRSAKTAVAATPRKSAKGRPAIMPSQSVDHGTPAIVAESLIYPVLGDPVDLDPCSNENSLVRARKKVILPENGLDIPWKGTVFVNPPYGEPEIGRWVRKMVVENRNNGAEIIALLPAHVSAAWFDYVVGTARACFLWGPGVGNRRLKFLGNAGGAAFHSAVVYWGPNLDRFTRHALRFCHPWFPEHDLRYARALVGDTRLPEGAETLLAAADEILTVSRNDDLAAALAALGSATLGDILDAGDTTLLRRLRGVCAYELGTALLYASRSTRQPWIDHRLPQNPKAQDPRQLGLANLAPAKGQPALGPSAPVKTLDDLVYDAISLGCVVGDPLSAKDLKDHLACSPGELRGALSRLHKAKRVIKTGRTQGVRYTVKAQAREEKG